MKTLAKVFGIIIAAIVLFTVILYPLIAVNELMKLLHVDWYGPLVVIFFSYGFFGMILIMGATLTYIDKINEHWK